jgi:probable rRNA maturation factor
MPGRLVIELPDEASAAVDLKPTQRVMQALIQSESHWLPHGFVNVSLVDDQAIAELNRMYGEQDGPTDVLSFNYQEGPKLTTGSDKKELGDIAVSLEAAKRQANEAGIAVADEVAFLVLHGVLHICGLDHQSATDQVKMAEKQTEIMSAANVKHRELEWK